MKIREGEHVGEEKGAGERKRKNMQPTQQSKVLIQFGLNLLNSFIGISSGGVQLPFQKAQANVGLAQLLALGEREREMYRHISYTGRITTASFSCCVLP